MLNNEILWFVSLVANFVFIMFAFRIWGEKGLLIWMPISCITANLQVLKNIVVFGLEATLGNIIYATAFLATDILNEFYEKKVAKRAVWYGFYSLISMTVLMQLSLLFIPSESDMTHSSMINLFSFMPRVTVASLVAYLVSNMHDVWAFRYWKKRTKGRFLWLRNNASTWVSQLIDSLIFTLGAFWGVYEWDILWQIILTTYLLKWLVAVMDTFMIYLARFWVNKGKIPDLKPGAGYYVQSAE